MKHVTVAETTFMGDANSKSTAKPRRRPTHRMLVAFSAAYFAGALVTDLVYWQMPDVMWERFSIWLILAGLVMAGLAPTPFGIDPASRTPNDRTTSPPAVRYTLPGLASLV